MTHIFNGSRHTWVMSHTCMSHVTESYAWHDSFEWCVSCVSLWVMSRTCVSHVTELIRTHDMIHQNDSVVVWVMSHMSVGHDTHMRESCHTFSSTMSHAWIRMTVSRLFFFARLSDQLPCKKKTAVTDLSRDSSQQSMVHMFNEWVMSRVSHVKDMRRSCHMTVSDSYEWRDPFLIDLCCVYAGLFCVYIGPFCVYIGLFGVFW